MFLKDGKLLLDDLDFVAANPAMLTVIFGVKETEWYGRPGYLTLGAGIVTAAMLIGSSYYARYTEKRLGMEYGAARI